MTTYLPAVLSIALVYGILGLALNLNWGRTGIINFGVVAFFAVGAYTSALLDTVYHVNIVWAGLAACLLSALAAVPVGWITLRLKADFLAIVTIGFAESLRIFVQGEDWTGGPSGVIGIHRLFSGSTPAEFNVAWFFIFAAATLIAFLLVHGITRSRLGSLLRAIKSDEIAVSMLGKNVVAAKTLSLVISATICGAAGVLYAHYIGYISPDQFTAMVTFYVWAGIIIGGSSDLGALLGCVLLVGLLEITRFVDWADVGFLSVADIANLRMMVVGLVILLFLIFRAEGILPYRPRRGARGPRYAEDADALEGGLSDSAAQPLEETTDARH
ncbi:Branched-chain amino acid transport system permease protein OS=Castellaniella defragrans OX=75697 GN=HNR28_001741 PE=4 SV=1 [Castellaniella defragrans]